MYQGLQPLFSDLDGQGLFAMLLRVDVAMSAFQIATSQYVKEYVSGVFLKSYGLFHVYWCINHVLGLLLVDFSVLSIIEG